MFDLIQIIFFSGEHVCVIKYMTKKNAEIACHGEQQIPDEISHSIYNALQFLATTVIRQKFISLMCAYTVM